MGTYQSEEKPGTSWKPLQRGQLDKRPTPRLSFALSDLLFLTYLQFEF